MVARLLLAVSLFLAATPAWADASTAVPEGSNFALFGIGLAGVLIGRRASMRKRD
ncbi:MAG: PEP-CTERM sorting domain-containing protein [Croceibacterium sp.]